MKKQFYLSVRDSFMFEVFSRNKCVENGTCICTFGSAHARKTRSNVNRDKGTIFDLNFYGYLHKYSSNTLLTFVYLHLSDESDFLNKGFNTEDIEKIRKMFYTKTIAAKAMESINESVSKKFDFFAIQE